MQGYITVALDHARYMDMALNLARSLKYFDPERQRYLVYNDKHRRFAYCFAQRSTISIRAFLKDGGVSKPPLWQAVQGRRRRAGFPFSRT